MPFFIKDKSGKYRDSHGQWKTTVRVRDNFVYSNSIAAQTVLNKFSRMSLAETGATVVEE
jgi:hypothetical protein